jgi:hypothetical protein
MYWRVCVRKAAAGLAHINFRFVKCPLFISCESLLNNYEISPLNRVYVHEKARLAVHPLAENDSYSEAETGKLKRG